MDRTHSSHVRKDTYSLPPRSRAGSGVSTTESLFQGLNIIESPPAVYLEGSRPRPSSSQGLSPPSPAYTSPFSPQSAYLPTPVSQTHSSSSPFPSLPEGILNAEWFDLPSRLEAAPILRVDPAQDYSQPTPSSSPPLQHSESATMRYEICPDPPFSSTSFLTEICFKQYGCSSI